MNPWEIKYIVLSFLSYHLGPIWCFLVGHKMVYDYGYDWEREDYCERCQRLDDNKITPLPWYLHRVYVWLVEKDWQWFNRFDEWTMRHFHLPDWWRY